MNTNSGEARVPSDVSSVEGGSENVPGVSQPQPYFQTASCHESTIQFCPGCQWEWTIEQTQGQ
jgi:hypothetical protein